jgi:simple sugar transport system ATP-binding protein
MNNSTPLLEAHEIGKRFGSVRAIDDVSLTLHAGEVLCLLGDNGAGKSTLIKVLSGVHAPSEGTLLVDGRPVAFSGPREALDLGIATVHQHVGALPLMSVTRNFFLGAELTKGWGPFRVLDRRRSDEIALEQISVLGLSRVTDGDQLVGTLSGGERQGIAIARALHFGARVLILDEPTAALGVKQSGVVLKYTAAARDAGLGVVFITHNPHHAFMVGNHFIILKLGRRVLDKTREDATLEELTAEMAGGRELAELSHELQGR